MMTSPAGPATPSLLGPVIGAGGHGQALGDSGPGLTTEGPANRLVGLAQPGCGARVRLGEPREPLGEDESRAFRLQAGEAADRDSRLDGPAETGQVGQSTGIATVDVAGLGAAAGASGHRRGDGQVDGQVVDAEGAINEAALWGSREEGSSTGTEQRGRS
jgi:hypothetical protein